MQDSALYLEADEDITSAIDKLAKAPGAAVQIVVPKRSTMLQSIINLKLLKKAAATHHKELVLVTGDKIATELASRVGLAVAPSLGAKAVLATAETPAALKATEEVIEAGDPAPPPPETPPAKPAASGRPPLLRHRELTDQPALKPPPPVPPAPEANIGPDPETAVPATPAGAAAKLPKVPNFNLFQSRLKWLGLVIILIGGYWAFMAVFTSAKITLYASGTQTSVDTSFAVDTSAQQSNNANAVLAGRTITASKDLSGPFTPTGQQDVGTKATGTITISNCYSTTPQLLVSGTRFQAADGNVFTSDSDVTVPGGQGSGFFGQGCTTPGTATVSVTASANGSQYNESSGAYNIPGLPQSEQTGPDSITAKGAQMSGGTTRTVTVVAQSDVDSAKTALVAKDSGNEASELKAALPGGYTAISASESTAISAITPSPAVGQQASTAALQLKITYTVLAVKTSDYQVFVHAAEQKQIGAGNQIYDDGLGSAQLTATGQDASGRPTFHFNATTYSGAKLDTTQIATQLKGKRYGDAATVASGLPGVQQATISIWPAWASNLPSSTAKIKVVIKIAKQ